MKKEQIIQEEKMLSVSEDHGFGSMSRKFRESSQIFTYRVIL